jgi:hypothetical protein
VPPGFSSDSDEMEKLTSDVAANALPFAAKYSISTTTAPNCCNLPRGGIRMLRFLQIRRLGRVGTPIALTLHELGLFLTLI